MHILFSGLLLICIGLPLSTLATGVSENFTDTTRIVENTPVIDLPLKEQFTGNKFGRRLMLGPSQYLFLDLLNLWHPSINYERPIKCQPGKHHSYRMRVGVGIMPNYPYKDLFQIAQSTAGLSFSRVSHRRIRRSEIGLGVVWLHSASPDPVSKGERIRYQDNSRDFGQFYRFQNFVGLQGIFGYRWEWHSGMFFRAALSPIFGSDFIGHSAPKLGAGISLGWRIRRGMRSR